MGIAIRRFQENDAKALVALTKAAIYGIGKRAYTPTQVAAWAAHSSCSQRFLASAAKGDTVLIAVDPMDRPIAYAVLDADGDVDMLYAHPDYAGRGLAGTLLLEVESRAKKAGVTRLFTQASEIARPVFERAGYVVLHRCDFSIGPDHAPVLIHNYAMEKRLG
mgnify:CR=1 FL=1